MIQVYHCHYYDKPDPALCIPYEKRLEIADRFLRTLGSSYELNNRDRNYLSLALLEALQQINGNPTYKKFSEKNTDQQIGEALTYAKRYAGCCALGIAPEETVDGVDIGGDTEVGRPEQTKAPKPRPEVIQGGEQLPLPPCHTFHIAWG